MPLPALSKPLSWKSKDPDVVAVLNDVQANILKGHGRDHTVNAFLTFTDPDSARRAIHQLSGQLKTAKQQLLDAESHRVDKGADGGTIRCFFLTFAGYKALDVPQKAPAGEAFRRGMKERSRELNDRPETWEPLYRKTIHAMLLLADDKLSRLRSDFASLKSSLEASGIEVLPNPEWGHQRRSEEKNKKKRGEAIEQFGFVDGRSQPIMLQEDIDRQPSSEGDMWDSAFPAKQVLVTAGDRVLGSFAVFRKLEQNPAAFRAARKAINKALGLEDANPLGGAMIVGRFPDGTPVVLRKQDGFGGEAMNNFNYADDALANKCPIHAHIRKMNPRGSSEEGLWGERRRVMARRGITYRKDKSAGILFLAYQSSFATQFEAVQKLWANEATFPKSDEHAEPGIDPIIGQRKATKGDTGQKKRGRSYPKNWGGPQPRVEETNPKRRKQHAPVSAAAGSVEVVDGEAMVTVKGGEYFFAPVISDLRTL